MANNIVPFTQKREEQKDEWDRPHPVEVQNANIDDDCSEAVSMLFWANDTAHPLSNEQKRHLRMVAAAEATQAAAIDDPQFRWVEE